MQATYDFSSQDPEAIASGAGSLARALKTMDPTNLPQDVVGSLERLRPLYLSLNEAQDAEVQAGLALAEEASHLLAGVLKLSFGTVASLPREAQDAASDLRVRFHRA